MKERFYVLKVFLFGAMAVVMTGGCISKPLGKGMANETQGPLLTKTVPPAPMQVYLKVGQSEQFTYWGHRITINYTSSHPTQVIKVSVDGAERTFQKGPADSPRGIYWEEGNLSFALRPVVWETRDGQEVPIYESTWNTSEVYFDVMVSGVGPTSIEDRQLQVVR